MHPSEYREMRAASLAGKRHTKPGTISTAAPGENANQATQAVGATGPPSPAPRISLADDPNSYVDTKVAAALCGTTASTLTKRRLSGQEPRYFRPAGLRRVLYRLGDLRAWIEAGERTSTTDAA